MSPSNLTRIVVTGGEGILATALRDYFPLAEYPSRRELDVANPNSCRNYFGHRQVGLVIHCGAETAHNAGADAYLASNILGTAHVAQWARSKQARLVYLSTDYVYHGPGPHHEHEATKPVNLYAASKLAGEYAASCVSDYLVVRGSWYATMAWTSAATDQYSSRLPVGKAAALIAGLATSAATGIVNVGGPRRSNYEVAVTEISPTIRAVNRVDIRCPYPLPADTSLDLGRMRRLA